MLILQPTFSFTTKWIKKYGESPLLLVPHKKTTSPTVNSPQCRRTFIISVEPTLTHDYHLKSIVYPWVPSWCAVKDLDKHDKLLIFLPSSQLCLIQTTYSSKIIGLMEDKGEIKSILSLKVIFFSWKFQHGQINSIKHEHNQVISAETQIRNI